VNRPLRRRPGGPRASGRSTLVAPLAGLALALALAACSSAPPPSAGSPAEPDPGIRPGDVVRVQVWREADLSGSFRVDDRGVVTLPLLGSRDVAGRDAAELRDDLLADYREFIQNPSIEVTVLRRINILGSVTQPGLYPVDETISLAEALGLAGGITPEGDPGDIRLYRDDGMVREGLDRGLLVGDIGVRSGDRIVVGEKNWFERNPGAFIGTLIAAAAGITVALIR